MARRVSNRRIRCLISFTGAGRNTVAQARTQEFFRGGGGSKTFETADIVNFLI